ncbi:dermonecrotic toxin domain-containing protein [Pseudomonas sp. A-R-26]|uniref:dermonecrotic toxin domain-containing protein n=1 Tax=Pseudomonas sp. A-R-26 TaxID=2832404 RepID=UPI001CBFAE93|nr:DUF6543 domain-containing protein [Pseudomonas sp. A-R-26]
MTDTTTPAQNIDKGRHYELIKNTTSDPFKTATLDRGLALAATPLKMQPWYTTTPASLHDKLKAANLKAWASQNKVDKLLKNLQDVRSFAAPLLQAKLKERYGIEHDVSTTYLRLYLPKDSPWYAIDVKGGVTSRTVSLLEAALHNFAKSETVLADSQYITKPDDLGHFDVIAIKDKMTISQFQALCRELDIGALYKEHLEKYLLPGEPVAEAVTKLKVTESQKDALAAAAQLALILGDIQYDAYKLMLSLAQDKEPQLLLNGRKMLCGDLSLLETRLTGILLLIPAVKDSRGVQRLIAYVPHDPDHPLKEYDSFKAFMDELTRQLREDKVGASSKQRYRQFFSQFIDQQQRGHFFADLDQCLVTVRWHEKDDKTDQRPTWREDPASSPHLQFQHLPVSRDYWTHAYQQKLNKILNDAQEIAVSTADTDSKARWAWWDNFKKIVSDIFNVALLIATPFVPGLGELMMAYTVYQMTTDVIEGIVDLAEGLGLEAAEHVIGVVTDVIQLAAFGAGAEIGSAFKLKLSPLVDGMKPVTLPDGKQTLWHPDLAPYEQKSLTLTPDSKPNEHGLHQHANQHILPLDDNLYVVEKASQEPSITTHRVKHPTRPNAYSPTVEHNGHGAWVHEAENPGNWEGDTLMRRLGHRVDRFSPTQREQIRISSGTEDNALRRMHVENAAPPPMLADTIKRFSAYDDVGIASANIRKGQPIDASSNWYETILTALPGWPSERALEVFEDAELTGSSRKYGNADATAANTLSISFSELTSGKLPEHVAGFLNESEIKALLGRDIPGAERTQALRDQLADAVDSRKGEIAKRIYQAEERSSKAKVRLLRQPFPDLPLTLAETVLAEAKAAELKIMDDEKRLPLRVKTQAREFNFEAGTARAYDGFYQDERVEPNTERLALNTLKFNTDSFEGLRIEVRDGTYDGTLRCSVGPDDAATVRRLVRDESGQYEVLDGDNKQLNKAGDFYESILRALPEDKRKALGYLRGQGHALKLWIMEKTAAPAERRTALAQPPVRPAVTIETETLLRGLPRFLRASTPEEKIKDLYPEMTEREVRTFIEKLRNDNGDPTEAIERLKSERQHLRDTLQGWRNTYPPETDVTGELVFGYQPAYLLNGGLNVEEQLIKCFERRSNVFGERNSHPDQGYTLDLSVFKLKEFDRWWSDLRQRPGIQQHLDQITALKLDELRTAAPDDLLRSFPNLRQLSARQCGLNEIPASVGRMDQLENLDLTDNYIKMTANTTQQLSDLTRLRTLNLNGNPLSQPPDVGRLTNLKDLNLANTGIQTWPEGLFRLGAVDQPRPRGFMLDMRSNPINTLPEVTSGSDHALILSRARFDTGRLSNADRVRLGTYRESAGLDFVQAYSPAAADEITHWQLFPDEPTEWGASSSLKKYREESWHDVLAEPGAEQLFAVIRKQRESADYQNDKSRRLLTRRVWELIDAAALNSALREELFLQAREPTNCREGGAYLFNSMGIKVLLSKAYNESILPSELDNKLVKLARSFARLDRVGDLAREEIGRQTQMNLIDPQNNLPPDDLEIHMAFQTGLAERLDLPWQAENMAFRARAGVDQGKIDAAYTSIMARESGNGLVDGMIEPEDGNVFWERHLKATHPTKCETNRQYFDDKLGLLDELRAAKVEWAKDHPQAQMNQLIRKMEDLADKLEIPQAEVFSDGPLSDRHYDDLAEARKELFRRLTREAMVNAGL